MRRREFIAGLGGAAAWPLAARGQHPASWRIGLLETTSLELNAANFAAFRQGLRDLGYVEGQNLVIEYRSADSADRFPDLAMELVGLQVDLIVLRGDQRSWRPRVPPGRSPSSWYRLPTR